MNDRLYQIWFALRCGAANREFVPLLEQYGSPQEIFMAEETEIERMPCSDGLKKALCDKSLGEAVRIWEYCHREKVSLLFYQDADYPPSLRILLDPPVLLYCKGSMPDVAKRLCIGMVGTRKMSEYGKSMAYKIGYELAAAGTVVVSGMALGIDSVSAAGALAAGGCTVAVLGCGIDSIYPSEHTVLANTIMNHGALVTEYPPGAPPHRSHFPVRNRLISALSQGVLVVEADQKSGALITAKCAITQGKDIYAVPGNVGESNTAGTNQLIRDGASVVLGAEDILTNYEFLYRDSVSMERLQCAQKKSEPCNDDWLARLQIYARTVTVLAPPAAPEPHAPAPAPARPPRGASSDTPRRSVDDSGSSPTPRRREVTDAPRTASPRSGDNSRAILDGLSEKQRRIFELLPLDHAVTLDQITREGFTVSEVLTAMTVLEIKGLTVCLPGGLFSRK